MKKLLVLILITVCFSFACVKAYYKDTYMVYETQKTTAYICIYPSGCCDKCGYTDRITYFVLDKKTAFITEIQYCDTFNGHEYKTYTNTSKAKLIAYDRHDIRKQVLRNYLENEYVKCLIK